MESCNPPGAVRIEDVPSLIRAMHARYAGRWYRTLSFKQTVTRTNPDGSARPPEIWAEYALLPGRLRIDFGDAYTGDGVLYAADRRYVFREGALVAAPTRRSHLLLVGFDVYAQPPERTLALLEEEGFDLSRLRLDTWQGRPAYVAGAEAGDLRSPQFWVDQERLVFVRLVEPSPDDVSKTSDIRFNAYQPAGSGWIAPEVVFLLDGEEVMREDYFDVQVDVELAPGLFDPARWGTPPA